MNKKTTWDEIDLSIKKEKELKQFLESIADISLQEQNIKEFINKLKNIYTNDYRHRYSYISSYIYESINSDLKKVININKNIELIYKYAQDPKNNIEFLIKSLDKLLDHINLEQIRIQDIERFKAECAKATDELEKTQQRLRKANQTIKQEIEKSRQQYIAILGIFAAIILAFAATFTFTNSVLSNIEKASIYRLTFIVLLIGMFIFNILNSLYCWINKIHFSYHQNEIKWYKNYAFLFNVIIFLLLGLNFVIWLCK